MNFLLKHIRNSVLVFSFVLSVGIYLKVIFSVPDESLQIITLTQLYAFTALTYLYLALLATPLTQAFPRWKGRGHYIRARRAIGQSTFYFALLHGSLAFWGQLGGFSGLPFLTPKFALAISLSTFSLCILACMAATSFDRMVSGLGHKKWKILHRFVYLASIFILIHATLIGTHLSDWSILITQIVWVAVAMLLILEAQRFDRYIQLKHWNIPPLATTRFILILFLAIAIYIALSLA